jgi:hypothetical protein
MILWTKNQTDFWSSDYITVHCITLQNIIIQLTPHWGFSVTDYNKYYAYLCYWLFILSLQQSRHHFPNYAYSNPPCQLAGLSK